jgi:voltage-gated potassium channel
MELRRRILTSAMMLTVVICLSVLGYRVLSHNDVELIDALYMAIITLFGVGYGEIVDTSHNHTLRIFNMFIVVGGFVIAAYVISSVTAFFVESDFSDYFRRRKMKTKINQLRGHYIVCGLGDTGRYAVQELQKTGSDFVVIDSNMDNLTKLRDHDPAAYDQLLYIQGDATDEDVLLAAGIEHAAGVLTSLPHEKDNLVVTVVVRQNNEHVRIVARCTDPKFAERLLKAGANSTVSPNIIGGLRLASEVLRPHVVGFLDLMLKGQSQTLRIEEIIVPNESPWVGKLLSEIELRKQFNLLTMAVKDKPLVISEDVQEGDGDLFKVNPPDNTIIGPSMVIITMGDVNDVRRARESAGMRFE